MREAIIERYAEIFLMDEVPGEASASSGSVIYPQKLGGTLYDPHRIPVVCFLRATRVIGR